MMFFVPKNAHRNRHDPTARLVASLLPRSARSQARHGSLVRPPRHRLRLGSGDSTTQPTPTEPRRLFLAIKINQQQPTQ